MNMVWIILKGIFFYIAMTILTAKIYTILDSYDVINIWDSFMLAIYAFLWPIFLPFIFLWIAIKKIIGWY